MPNYQKIKELNEQRNKLTADARKILDDAKAADRQPTEDETRKFDELIGKANDLKVDIDTLTAEDQRNEALEEHEEHSSNLGSHSERRTAPDQPGERRRSEQRTAELPEEFRNLRPEDRARLQAISTPEYRSAFRSYLIHGISNMPANEVRSLQADLDESGGFLVAPLQMAQGILKAVDDLTFIRSKATKFQVTGAHGTGITSLDADPDDADWVNELQVGDEDTTMDFGRRELYPRDFSKLIKISRKLLRMTPSVEGFVQGRLAYKMGITEEKAFLTGSGAGQPLGLFTASSDGISTGQDVSTGNTTTSIQFDGLKEAKFTLKQQYWARAEWLFHRDAMKQIAKLKDGEGRYMWQPSTQVGVPDMLDGHPLNMSEYAPNTFTTGLYVGMFGDFSKYYIADSMMIEFQRLQELYAATAQIGYIVRAATDGMPALEEAFARVTLA